MLVPLERIVWLPSTIWAQCVADADRFFDNETGGALMGYWRDGETCVITAAIDAGPQAVRERDAFEPDQQWQIEHIALHYEASGRRETYIGDWHTHPRAQSNRLSSMDRGVLRRIIETPSARAPTPLMLLLYGVKAEWRATAWAAELKYRPILWARLLLSEAVLRVYEDANT